MDNKHSAALMAIVCYKAFNASLLAITSLALLLTLKNHENLEHFSNEYVLKGKLDTIKWLLYRLTNFDEKNLIFSAIAAGIYAAVTAIEAIGLWDEKIWATILVLVLVGISIPAEIYELIRGVTLLKLALFGINVAVFGYLLHHWVRSQKLNDAS